MDWFPKNLRMLLVLVVLNILASVIHYGDNICFFSEYPEPSWLNPHLVDAFWFVMTPFAVLGYWYGVQGWRGWSKIALNVYAIMSLLVLGHYLITPPWHVSLKINAFIFLETIAAIFLIYYVNIRRMDKT
ncbi:hypothetical protein ACN4EG_14625 [Alkalinema pantanalense CENA528]|uniref:hypothetical protein n=1 Tax=Alkalinema pantanalense TaxID=1620705 RepID=UPI003D6F3D3B